MKALCCVRPGLIEFVDRPAPVPVADQVLVDIKYVGICGTDYHIFQGSHPYIPYPLVLGHELSGVVNANSRARGFVPGDPLVINPYLACQSCQACRSGKTNCCENLRVLGIHSDGGMCAKISVPVANAIVVKGLGLRDAAMVEFLAIGAHAVRRTGITQDQEVLVVGAGPIGLATAIFARIAGARVTIMDIAEEKLGAARAMGFERTLQAADPKNSPPAPLGQFRAVFDATGNIQSMNRSIFHTGHGGSYTLVGVITGDLVFPDAEVHKREWTIRASRNATGLDFEHVIASILGDEVPTGKLATHSCTLEEAPERLAGWAGERADVIKAIIAV